MSLRAVTRPDTGARLYSPTMKAVVIFLGCLLTLHAAALGQTASPTPASAPAAEPAPSIPPPDPKYGVYPMAYKELIGEPS